MTPASSPTSTIPRLPRLKERAYEVKRLLWIVAVTGGIGVVAPYLPLTLLRPGIERALQRGLGGK